MQGELCELISVAVITGALLMPHPSSKRTNDIISV